MAKSRSVWVPEVNLSFDFSFWLLIEVLIMTSGSASAIFGQEDDLESFLATDLLGTVVGSGRGVRRFTQSDTSYSGSNLHHQLIH